MSTLTQAKTNPSSVFKSPLEVVNSKDFSKKAKIEILQSWAYDEREKQVAEEENMRSTHKERHDLFAEIEKALLALGYEPSKHDDAVNKEG